MVDSGSDALYNISPMSSKGPPVTQGPKRGAAKVHQGQAGARERLLDAAYALFATRGIGPVGIDTVIAEAGCAKASLYYNFDSKDGLALAFLDRREALWTRGWLEQTVCAGTDNPAERLLAIFDLFDGWFQRDDFEGCSFINVLLETPHGGRVNRAAADHLAKIRAIVRAWADEAGLADTERFAQAWHIMMKGSIVAAGEGHRGAARDARQAAALVLAGWPRRYCGVHRSPRG